MKEAGYSSLGIPASAILEQLYKRSRLQRWRLQFRSQEEGGELAQPKPTALPLSGALFVKHFEHKPPSPVWNPGKVCAWLHPLLAKLHHAPQFMTNRG